MDDFSKLPVYTLQGPAESRRSRRICSIKMVLYFKMKNYQKNSTG